MMWSTIALLSAALIAVGNGNPVKKTCLHKRADSGDIVFPGTQVVKCPSDTSCVQMESCPQAFTNDGQIRPTICKWEVTSPLICCPRTNADIKLRNGFPEADCARAGFLTKKKPRTGSILVKRELLNDFHVAVVGGTDVEFINDYPFMAGIYQTAGDAKLFICGGTLISKNFILTAAHCFLSMENTSKYLIQLGSVKAQVDENIAEIKEFEVTSVKLHPGFKFPVLYNDIALLKFEGLNGYSDSIKPICLMNEAEDRKALKTLKILGWGSKKAGASSSPILQEADINIVSNINCNQTLAQLGALAVSYPRGINTKVLCAGGTGNVSKDACQGDSGGPAIVLVDGIWRQRGVVSGGIGCGVPGNPGLYTRVSEFITWILENV